MPKRIVKKKVPGTENNKRLKKSRKENANLTECPPCEGVFISIKSSPKYYNSDMEDAYGIDNVAKIIKKEPASSDDVDNVVKTIKKEHAPDEKILPDEGQSEIEVVYEIDNIAKIVKNEPVMSEEFKNNFDANEYSQSNDEFSCEEGFQTVPVRQISGSAKHRKNGTKQNPRKKSNSGKEHAIIQANSTTDKAKIVPTTSTTANDFSTTAESLNVFGESRAHCCGRRIQGYSSEYTMLSNGPKKIQKRKRISLEQKAQILERIKCGEKINKISEELHLSRSTISGIQKREDKIRKRISIGSSASINQTARIKNNLLARTENSLMKWIENGRQTDLPLDGHLIKKKAIKVFEYLKAKEDDSRETFVASNGWFEGFKRRFSLNNAKRRGERSSADNNDAESNKEYLVPLVDEKGNNISEESSEIVPNEHYECLTLEKLNEGLQLFKALETHFTQHDCSAERLAEFKQKLEICRAPYYEIREKMQAEVGSDNKEISPVNNQRDDETEQTVLKKSPWKVLLIDSDSN